MIKDFLTFSRGERNGIIILIILMLILVFAPIFYRSFLNSTPSSSSGFYAKADSFFASITIKPDESVKTNANPIENEEIEPTKIKKYFFFDPNTVTIEEMVQLGLSVKQSNIIEKYRSKGGQFRTPKEFSKVYVIDSSTYHKLEPWIKINLLAINVQHKVKQDTSPKLEKTPIHLELNSTDTIELVKIRGVGKIFARRIIAYRNMLGGYVSTRQLTEVYGIKPELVTEIVKSINIDSSKIKQININLATYEELKKHPYLTDYQAKAIIYYRSKVGNVKSTKELLLNKILPFEKYSILKSYLTTF